MPLIRCASLALIICCTVMSAVAGNKELITLQLEQDLRFGGDQDSQEFNWPGTEVSVDADAKGNIFVTDPMGKRILKFDQKGAFVGVFGGPGEGPGEFKFVQGFQILNAGNAVAFGTSGANTFLNYYDSNLVFQNRKTLSTMGNLIKGLTVSPDGKRQAGLTIEFDQKKPIMIVRQGVLDPEFQMSYVIAQTDTMSYNPQRSLDPQFWIPYLADQFKGTSHGSYGFYAFDNEGSLYTAKGSKYEITRWDSGMNKMYSINHEYKAISLTETQIQAMATEVRENLLARVPANVQAILTESLIKKSLEAADFPPAHMPINGLLTMEDNKLIVIHFDNKQTGESMGDVFGDDGQFVGSFKQGNFGMARMRFKNGYAYTVETEDDENFVVRYKYHFVPKK